MDDLKQGRLDAAVLGRYDEGGRADGDAAISADRHPARRDVLDQAKLSAPVDGDGPDAEQGQVAVPLAALALLGRRRVG